MRVAGVIPARYASTRFPGKPLAPLLGKPLLAWVIEASQQVQKIQDVIVATDDLRIKELAESCGALAMMTSSDLPTGSDRVWSVVKDLNYDIVLNIQGDEPLINPRHLELLVEAFEQSNSLPMATLGRPLRRGEEKEMNVAKIVLNNKDEAIYFSRWPVPFSRLGFEELEPFVYKHIGVYAYKKEFLGQYCECGAVSLERAESLEQLRALYLGATIKVVKVEGDSWGVDVPEDIKIVEAKMKKG